MEKSSLIINYLLESSASISAICKLYRYENICADIYREWADFKGIENNQQQGIITLETPKIQDQI